MCEIPVEGSSLSDWAGWCFLLDVEEPVRILNHYVMFDFSASVDDRSVFPHIYSYILHSHCHCIKKNFSMFLWK